MTISVLIMTYNEEVNLPACLASVAWSDDIVVLDSFSTDRTVEIARAAGARIYQRPFDSEPAQRNYGLGTIPFKYPWVYFPDADEVTTSELRDEMRAIAADPSRQETLFRVRFKVIFMGRWLRRSALYPTWIPRFARPGKLSFERSMHCRCVSNGPEGRLQNHFIHYSFNKGLNAWYEKHNRYSSAEAQEALDRLARGGIDWAGVLTFRDPVRRRRALKELSFRLPCRPTLRFLYMYVVRLGFLDGWPGYVYCRMLSSYEYMIVFKMAEIRRRRRGLPV